MKGLPRALAGDFTGPLPVGEQLQTVGPLVSESLFKKHLDQERWLTDLRYEDGVAELYTRVVRELTGRHCPEAALLFVRATMGYHKRLKWSSDSLSLYFIPHPDFRQMILEFADELEQVET